MAVIKPRIRDGRLAPVVELVEPVKRNFMMHIWPVKGFGTWQWNCDQVLKRADLFNGKRIIAIAVSNETDHAYVVKEYMRDFTDDFIVVPNHVGLREVVTFIPMLEKLESLDPTEVTFACHAKGVRHALSPDDLNTTIFPWTKMMYDLCLDYWPLVRLRLQTAAMVGNFRRFGEFTTPGNNRWHYSGTFYWFRHRDVFENTWRKVDQKFFGTESWPGHLFGASQTACLFKDSADDMYDARYVHLHVVPECELWKKEHQSFLQDAAAQQIIA